MKTLNNTQELLERAYIGLVEDALNSKEKRTDNVIRCCKCKRCDVTLRKLHKGVYACTDCIKERSAWEVTKEFERAHKTK